MLSASPWTRLHVYARETATQLGPPEQVIAPFTPQAAVAAAMQVCARRPFDDATPAVELMSEALFDLGIRSFGRSATVHAAMAIAGSQSAEEAWRQWGKAPRAGVAS